MRCARWDFRSSACYQYGKPNWPGAPSDFTRGYDGGVSDAQTALLLHVAAGGPESAPIFFSIDEDIDAATWKSTAVQWLRGINSVLGVERTGVYGSAGVCGWAIADNVIGHSTTPGYRWAWQTRAWSDGEREPAAVLYQRVIVTASDPGISLGGPTSTRTTSWRPTTVSGISLADSPVTKTTPAVTISHPPVSLLHAANPIVRRVAAHTRCSPTP